MGGKRIIVDHQHAMRQHKAFAIMVIVLLLAVLAIWFIQIRIMVRDVDLSKVRQDVLDTQASFQAVWDANAAQKEEQDATATEDVTTSDATIPDAVSDDVRAAVGAAAAAEFNTDLSEEPVAAEDAGVVTQ